MVVAPLEDELKRSGAPPAPRRAVLPTLLWSLDGVLRYLPMAALYDGHRYMVERFNNVLFTPESYGHMTDAPLMSGSAPSVLAMGLSKSYGGLPALPGVMPELDAVVHDPAVPESHGPMEGKLLPNEQFTLAALKTELGAGKSFPVVHIASHFVVETGSGEEPYLMLGGEDAGDAEGICVESLRDGELSGRLSRHAASHPLGLQHGEGLQITKRPGDGQPGHDRPAERCRSGAGHALGCERRQHQPAHERLLRAMGERPRRWQSRSPAQGAVGALARGRRIPRLSKRTWR